MSETYISTDQQGNPTLTSSLPLETQQPVHTESSMKSTGSASGLLGVLQLLIGAIAAPLVGMGGTTSALPLAIAIAAFGIATLIMVLLLPALPRHMLQRVSNQLVLAPTAERTQ